MHTTVSKGKIDAHRGILYYTIAILNCFPERNAASGLAHARQLSARGAGSDAHAVPQSTFAACRLQLKQVLLCSDTRNGLQKSTQQWNLPLASLSATQFYCEAYTTCREVFSLRIIDCQREHQSSFYHPRAAFIAFVFLHYRHKNTHAHET